MLYHVDEGYADGEVDLFKMRPLRDVLGQVLRAAAHVGGPPIEPWAGDHYLTKPERVGHESELLREHWRQRADEVLTVANIMGIDIVLRFDGNDTNIT